MSEITPPENQSFSGVSKIVGVRFRQAGKVYYFNAGGIPLEINDLVVVQTSHGPELGRVVISPKQISGSEQQARLQSILRKAQPEDMEKFQKSREKEREALSKCQELVKQFNLAMKPLSAQSNLEGRYITIFFSAEERVDFRELVRKLSRSLKARVELKQVGPRDEAKLIGGLGKCGRPLCCLTFLSEFTPVSVRMAKEQGLSLSPMKISGICGRLLCCLGYESDQYRAMKEKLPKIGQQVSTSFGKAKVVGSNPFKETVMVELENQVTTELPLGQVTWEKKGLKEEPKRQQESSGK